MGRSGHFSNYLGELEFAKSLEPWLFWQRLAVEVMIF